MCGKMKQQHQHHKVKRQTGENAASFITEEELISLKYDPPQTNERPVT
jgi:hypothetical protein